MISSIDNVLVRAAASSIASGRPSSDRHSSSTASSIVDQALALALRGGAAGEQLDGVGERERRELEHGLAVDVEWHLAGAQDPQPGRGVEEADGERRRRRRRRVRSCRGSPARRLPLSRSNSAASPPVTFIAAISVSTTSSAVTAVSSRANQTPPARACDSRRPAGRDRDRGLADATWPDDLDEPVAGEQLGQRSDLGCRDRRARPTSTAGSRPTSGRSGVAVADRLERRVVDQDLLLELLQLRPGSRPSSSANRAAPAGTSPTRRLGAPLVQRGDQQHPQTFLVRVARHGHFQVADRRHRCRRGAAVPSTRSR